MMFALAPFLITLWIGFHCANAASAPKTPHSFFTVKNSEAGNGVTLSFSQTTVPFASFVRKGFFWFVIPSSNPLRIKGLKFPSGFGAPETVKAKGGEAFRLKVPEGVYPLIKYQKDQVQIFLNTRPLSVPLPSKSLSTDILKIDSQKKLAFLEVPHTEFITIHDPETSEDFIVLPLKSPESGFFTPLKKRDFSLCSTLQGLLIEMKPEVFIKPLEGRLILSRIGGLKLSPPQDQQFASAAVLPQDAFPFTLPKEKQNFEEEIALSSGIERLSLLWKQLQQQLSYGEMSEASAQLSLLAQNHPEFEKLRLFQMTKGISFFFRNQLAAAFYALSKNPWIKEMRPWINATRLKNGEKDKALASLEEDLPLLSQFHPVLQGHLLLLAAQGSIYEGQEQRAHKFLRHLPKGITPEQEKYAKSLLQQLVFEPLVPGPPAPTQEPDLTKPREWLRREAKLQTVFEMVLSGYRVGRFTPAQALSKIKKLQWESRSPLFESQVLKFLGELYEAKGEIIKGLESYTRFLRRFKEDPDYPEIESKALVLYHEAILSPDLPFYTRFAIFRRFEEAFFMKLQDKFEILSTLTHDLISHDLLEDSLKLLSQQQAPPPDDILMVAEAYFEKEQPQKLLDLLKKYAHLIPPEKAQEVLLLQSKALKQIGLFNEALSLIPQDGTLPQLLQRASLLMEKKAWKEAIPLLEKIVGKQKNPDIETIESLAIALYQTQNDEKLSQLLTPENQKRSSFLKTLAHTSSATTPTTFQELKENLRDLQQLPSDLSKDS